MRNELHHINGLKFSLYQARLRDEMPCPDEKYGNPVLWWGRELNTPDRDWIVCGITTKREALQLLDAAAYSWTKNGKEG